MSDIEELARLRAELAYAKEVLIPELRREAALWKGLYEDERRDHEATIKHVERAADEYSA